MVEAYLEQICDEVYSAGDGIPSCVYIQSEFGCANIRLEFGELACRINDSYVHHEVEIGSFAGNWRIIDKDRVILASGDMLDEAEFNSKLGTVKFGRLEELVMLSSFDFRLVFQDGLKVDFLCSASDEDVVNCFMRCGKVVSLGPNKGWYSERRFQN